MASNYNNPINILDSKNAIGLGSGGSLNVEGGASIKQDTFIGGSLSVSGTSTAFSDNIMIMNKNPVSTKDTGILFERYIYVDEKKYSGLIYNETSDEFIFGYANSDNSGTGITFGNYIPIRANQLLLMSTENSIGLGSGGSLTVLGGASISKTLNVSNLSVISNNNTTLITTAGNVGIGTSSPSKSLDIIGDINLSGDFYKNGDLYNPGSQWTSFNNNVAYTKGNIGINTTSPNTTLDVNGTANFSSSITTSSVNATNLVSSPSYTGGSMNLSGDLVVGGSVVTVNVTTTNVKDINISTGTLNVSDKAYLFNATIPSLLTSNALTTNISSTTLNVTTATVGTARVTTSLLAIGNSNTIGNIFTTGGNVGVGTVTPSVKLDVSGDISSYNYKLQNWNNHSFGVGFVASPTYYKIATLPPTADTNGSGGLSIKGMVGGWYSHEVANIDLFIASRNGIVIRGHYYGGTVSTVIGLVDLQIRIEANNTYSVYLVCNGYIKFDLIVGGIGVGVVLTSPNMTGTTTPTGSPQTASIISVLQMHNISGNIGIGTNSPATTLDVSGTIRASTSLTTGTVYSTNITSTNIVATNVSAGILNLSTGLTASSAQLTNANVTTSTIATLLNTNQNSTNVSAATLNLSGTARITGTVTTGDLNVSGNLRVGNSTQGNYIEFYGTSGDSAPYQHTFIGERIYGGTERSELLLFKGNDVGNPTGPDRIRHLAANHVFDTYTSIVSGTFDAVGTSGTTRMLIDNSGNVGIGVSNPSLKLEVSGRGVMKNAGTGTSGALFLDDTNKGIQYSGNNTGVNSYFEGSFPTDGIAVFGFADGALGTKKDGNRTCLMWTSSGNVGISTTSPAYTLDVNGTFETSNSNGLMLFASSGNLGIGTTNPGTKLDVSGTARITTSITTGGVFSTNITSTNVVATNITSATLNLSIGLTSASAQITNAVSTNITSTNIIATNSLSATGTITNGGFDFVLGTTDQVNRGNSGQSRALVKFNDNNLVINYENDFSGGTNVFGKLTVNNSNASLGSDFNVNGTAMITTSLTTGALYSTNLTSTNIVTTNVSAAAVRVTNNLLATGNSNTIGNIFTTGGNVGINTTSPVGLLDVRDPTNFVGDDGGALYITGGTNGNRRLHMGYANTANYGWIESVEKTVNFTSLSLQPRGGNVGIGTTSPANTLDVSGTARITTSITTGALFSTNITSTNIVATNVSAATLNLSSGFTTANANITTATVATLLTTNIISTNISTSTISATTMTGGNLSLSGNLSVAGTLTTVNITSTNLVNTNVSAGVVVASTSLSATGNSNTIGTIFTNSGNVGIGRTVPLAELHLATNNTYNNILFEPGYTSDGGNPGWASINFNGYHSGGEQRINTSKNRWRIYTDQRNENDNMAIETFNGTTMITLMSFATSGNVSIPTLLNTNAISTNISSATLNLSSGLTSSSAQLTNANVTTSTIATLRNTNAISTNISSATLNLSSGLTSSSAQLTNANVTTLTVATLLNTNAISTNISSATLNLSTGLTTASAQLTNANVTTSTIATLRNTNAISTNISSATLNLSSGLTSSSAQLTNANVTTLTVATLLNTNQNSTNITSTNIVATNLSAVGSITNGGYDFVLGTTDQVSRGNSGLSRALVKFNGNNLFLNFDNDFSGGTNVFGKLTVNNGYGLSGSYDFNVNGTAMISTSLTTGAVFSTNITSTNVVATNVSAGVVVASTSLSATGNSNTIGTIFTNSGNVGIGRTVPLAELHLATNNTYNNILFEPGYTSDGGNAGWGSINFNGYHSAGEQRINTGKNRWRILVDQRTTNDNMVIDTFNGTTLTTLMSFATSGNIGIGTQNPATKLHLADTGSVTLLLEADSDNITETDVPTIQFRCDGGITGMDIGINNNVRSNSGYIDFNSTGQTGGVGLGFLDNGVCRMWIGTSGSVGIDTTSPSGKLHTSLGDATNAGSTNFWDSTFAVFGKSSNTGGAVGIGFHAASGGSLSSLSPSVAWQVMRYRAADHRFFAGGDPTTPPSMLINTIGNIGIGTTSPANTLDVSGTARITTSLTTGALFSTNLTSTNVVATNLSAGTLALSNVNISNATIASLLTNNQTIIGTLGSFVNLPKLMMYGTSDVNNPLYYFSAYDSNNIGIGFGAYINTAGSVRMSTTSTSWLLGKNANGLSIVKCDGTVGSAATQDYRLHFATSGNVGIGTTSPANTLDVSGTARITTSLTTGALFSTNITSTNVVATNLSAGTLALSNVNISNATIASLLTNNQTIIGTLGSFVNLPKLMMYGTSDVNNPLYYFSAYDSNNIGIGFGAYINTAGSVRMSTTSTSWLLGKNANGLSIVKCDGTVGSAATQDYRLHFATSGNVGIGTIVPSRTLHVTNNMRIGGSGAVLDLGDDFTTQIYRNGTTSEMRLTTNQIDRVTITSTGNLGIGTTSPVGTLDVRDTTNFVGDDGGALYITGGTNGNRRLHMGYANTANYGWIEAVEKTVNLTSLSLQPRGGNVGIGNTSPISTLSIFTSNNLAGNTESGQNGLSIQTGTSAASDMILYMGADKTNKVSYIQSVLWGSATNPLILNPRGGNVGIGTTSPGNTLDVSGTARITTSITTAALYSTNITSTNIVVSNITMGNLGNIRFNNDGSGLIWGNNFSRIYDDGHLRTFTDDQMFFHIGNTTGTAMYIGSNSSVGIGTTAPQTKLHVDGTIRSSYGMIVGTLGSLVAYPKLDLFFASNLTHPTISMGAYDSFNNSLGFGTYLNTAGSSIMSSSTTAYSIGRASDNFIIRGYNGTLGSLANSTTAGELKIKSGNFSINGAGDPYTTLSMNGDAVGNGALQVVSLSNSVNGGRSQDGASFKAWNDGNNILQFYNSAGAIRGSVGGNGASAVTYNTSSDRRLKENVVNMSNSINIIKQMRPVEFTWKSDNRPDYGFIAQEIYDILPNLRPNFASYSHCECTLENISNGVLCECPDHDHDEPVDKEGKPLYYGLDYGKITPYLTKALQETIAELEKLRQDFEEYKSTHP